MTAYNVPEKVAVNGTIAQVENTGGYVEPMPGWLWQFHGSHDLRKGVSQRVDMPACLLMKQLNIKVVFAEGTQSVINSMESQLDGVATSVDLESCALAGNAKVVTDYANTGEGKSYITSKRILGVTSGTASDKFSFTVDTDKGIKTFDVDISQYMVGFNTSPIAIYNVVILVNNLDTTPTGEVDDWEEGEDPEKPVYSEKQLILLWEGCPSEYITYIEVIDDDNKLFASPMVISEHKFKGELLAISTELIALPESIKELYLTTLVTEPGEVPAEYSRDFIPMIYVHAYDPETGIIDMAGGDNSLDPQVRSLTKATTRSGDTKAIYQIRTASDLDKVRNRLADDHWQMRDIDLSAYTNWLPIGKTIDGVSDEDIAAGLNNQPFTGQYYGRGFKIKNLTMDYTSKTGRAFGLFALVGSDDTDVILDGITIESGDVKGSWYTAAVCGQIYPKATVTNCNNKIAVKGRNRSGGVVGYIGQMSETSPYVNSSSYALVQSCSNSGNITCEVSGVGGVVGRTEGYIDLIDCHNSGYIMTTEAAGWCGGVIGSITDDLEGDPPPSPRGLIKNCTNRGNVKASYYGTGGVAGVLENTDVENCINYGPVSGYTNVGGIVGQSELDCTITRSRNEGTISCNMDKNPVPGDPHVNTAGIVGLSFGIRSITDCVNTGTVSGGRSVGGIVGALGEGLIDRCYNTGTIDGYRTEIYSAAAVGGIVGAPAGDYVLVIRDSYNAGALQKVKNIGGIISALGAGSIISGCYNVGPVDNTTQSSPICATNKGTIVSTYYIDEVDDTRPAIFADSGVSETIKFSGTAWPSPSGDVWGSSVWKSLGAWSPRSYPKLAWE